METIATEILGEIDMTIDDRSVADHSMLVRKDIKLEIYDIEYEPMPFDDNLSY